MASNTVLGTTDFGTSKEIFFCAKWQFAHTIRPVASRGFSYPCWAYIGNAVASWIVKCGW